MNWLLAQMLDPSSARASLADRGVSVADLTVASANLREDWAIQYEARVLDPANGEVATRRLTAQRFLNGDFPRAAARIRQQLERAAPRDPALAGLVAEYPDLQCLVFPFPLDARIKYLPLAADRKKVRRRFFGRRCSVQTLRYVPARRCQLLYRSRSGEVLGKIFRDERGQTLFQTMEQVAARFTSHGDRLLWAPRPIQYLPDWQMLIQEKAPGRTLYEMIQDGSARDRHIEAAARSLAVLHGASLVPGSLYAVSDEIQLLEWSVRSLQALEIGEAPFAPSLDRIRAFGRRLRCSAPVPVHRDFYDKQLLMEGDAAALIDLDTLALGQAEIDVANFLAHLRLRSREERWQDLFLDCYRRTAPAPPDERLLCFFLSTTYFRLACKNRIHTGDGEAPCDRLLELAGDALGGV